MKLRKNITYKAPERDSISQQLTQRIDVVVTHRWLGYPIFFGVIYLMFYCTFAAGKYPMDWIDAFMGWLGTMCSNAMSEGPLRDLLVEGIIAGVGGVIVFLPNILILYAFISLMENSGYLERVALIMDRFMHRLGLEGKSFIPMIMGFGCNIPAIMATRIIENRKSRLITMMIVPLMSCSARLPVYIIIIGAFFPAYQALVLFALYLMGIVMSVVMAHVFSKFVVHGESLPYTAQLPLYRKPSLHFVGHRTWESGKEYLQKIGTSILAASIIIWALAYFPHHEALSKKEQMEQSYIGHVGKALEPLVAPCGMSWKESISLLSGIGAKEIVASTMAVLYQPDTDVQVTNECSSDNGTTQLSKSLIQSGMTPLAAFCFLIFILLYMPCVPACLAIKHEAGKWRYPFFAIAYTTLLAWLVATIVFQIGSLFL